MRDSFDPARVPEFFVTGVARIEQMGGVARHVLVSERFVRGRLIYVPEVHIIISNANCQTVLMKTAQELAVNLIGFDSNMPAVH